MSRHNNKEDRRRYYDELGTTIPVEPTLEDTPHMYSYLLFIESNPCRIPNPKLVSLKSKSIFGIHQIAKK
jgi:hypothetical protein